MLPREIRYLVKRAFVECRTKPRLNEELREDLRLLLPNESEQLLECCSRPLRESIRVNTLKIDKDTLVSRLTKYGWVLNPVRWCDYAYWVERSSRDIGKTLEHALGYYYMQGAVSLVPVVALGPQPGEKVLDICAAPGSKTTQMGQEMRNTGVIVANDSNLKRIRALSSNTQKCGLINCVITGVDGRRFPNWAANTFDRVLVDAPCTATGIIRKSWAAASSWTRRLARRISRLQRSLLLAGFDCLKPEGEMVYATCSLSPEENEVNVSELLRARPKAELLTFEVPGIYTRPGVVEWRGRRFDSSIAKTIRIYPHDNDAEGFFIAKVAKAK